MADGALFVLGQKKQTRRALSTKGTKVHEGQIIVSFCEYSMDDDDEHPSAICFLFRGEA